MKYRTDHIRDITKMVACTAILILVGTAQAGEHVWGSVPPGCKLFQKHDYAKVQLVCDGDIPQEPTKIGDSINDCVMWFDKDNGIQVEGKGCEPYLQKNGCYKRMQEAMTEMEKSLALESNQKDRKQPVWLIPELVKPSTWNRVMRDCVK